MTVRETGVCPMQNRDNKGSALLITAILALIAGLALVGLIYSVSSVTRESQEEQTLVKMHHVIHALSVYYQRYDRIPCPADPNVADTNPPFGSERGSGPAGTSTGSCSDTIGHEDGIVPFRTLGLDEDQIKDGWGHYFTYHISGMSNMDNGDAEAWFSLPGNQGSIVSQLCRVKDVWSPTAGVQTWYYAETARCCVTTPTDGISIVNTAGQSVTGYTTYSGHTASINSVAPVSSIQPPYTLPNPPALVLISHGANGLGAYLGTGTDARIAFPADAADYSTAEWENAQGDKGNTTFYMQPRTQPADKTKYFDDIVMFENLSQLYAEVGNNTGGGCNFQPGCPPIPVADAVAAGNYVDEGHGHKSVYPGMLDLNGKPCP